MDGHSKSVKCLSQDKLYQTDFNHLQRYIQKIVTHL